MRCCDFEAVLLHCCDRHRTRSDMGEARHRVRHSASSDFFCVRVIRWPRDLHLHVGTLLHAGARGIDGDDCEDGWLSFWLLGRSTGHLLGLFSGMWRVPASGW